MNVGQRIREVREDLGMPGAVLARRAGVAKNHLYMIEHGSRTPSLGLLVKIAHELRVEPADLLREPVPVGEASQAGPADTTKGPDPLGGWISRALSEGEFAREFERAKGSQELADELRRTKDAEVTERNRAVATLRKRNAPPDEILEAQRDRIVSNAQLTAAAFLATELWRGHDVSATDPRTIVADVMHNQRELLAGGPTAQPQETA